MSRLLSSQVHSTLYCNLDLEMAQEDMDDSAGED